MAGHRLTPDVMCPTCGQWVEGEAALMFHDRAAHMRDPDAPRNPSHGDLRCDMCGATMRNEHGLAIHRSRIHGDRSRVYQNFQGRPNILVDAYATDGTVLTHVKGKGVSFMENVCEYHGKPLTKEQLVAALKELT